MAIEVLKMDCLPKCDGCGEDADYSDYGISLCHSCRTDNIEGLGHLMNWFERNDLKDRDEY